MQRPFHQLDPKLIGIRVAACLLILHNMGVSDRVMEDVRAQYNPVKSVEDYELDMEAPDDIHDYQKPLPLAQLVVSGGESLDYYDNIHLISKLERWDTLIRRDEHIRLTDALMDSTETMENPRFDKKARNCRNTI
jgi:hypothetical protein